MSSRVGFTGFSISTGFSLNLVRDWLRLGRFIMVLDVDSLILPVEVVLGLFGSKKDICFRLLSWNLKPQMEVCYIWEVRSRLNSLFQVGSSNGC